MDCSICIVPVCPIRAEASHRSEQVSQLLFGEVCEVQERTKDFVKVRVVYDDYEGWCQENQLDDLTTDVLPKMKELTSDWINQVKIDDKIMNVPFGCPIPESGAICNHTIIYNGASINVEKNTMSEELLQKYSFIFLNTAYLWGGRSVFGVDCSGFTQLVFKCLNIPLLRDASQQVTQGDEVGFLEEVRCGDLAFFDNEAGKITHVGILLNSGIIIHASGKVRIDTIDNLGIINAENKKRTHKLRLIKRIAKQPSLLLF